MLDILFVMMIVKFCNKDCLAPNLSGLDYLICTIKFVYNVHKKNFASKLKIKGLVLFPCGFGS